MKSFREHSYLKRLHRQWLAYAMLSYLFIAIGVSAVLVSILGRFAVLSFWWSIPLTFVVFGISILSSGILKIGEKYVARILNQAYSELEESAELLTKPIASLNLLERLQVTKVKVELSRVSTVKLSAKRLKLAGLALIMGLALALGISQLPPFHLKEKNAFSPRINTPEQLIPDKILAGIKSLELRIKPPAYTRLPVRNQAQFSVAAAEGSTLTWQISTSDAIKNIRLIFNDQEIIPLRAVNKEGTLWTLTKTVIKSGFYQVDLEGTLSDLYKLDVSKDQPPIIRIISPAQYSSIDFGEPQRTTLQVQITDDFGINDAFISATISSGQGEGVKFKEQKLSFQQNFQGAISYKLNKLIDLKGLGMLPGDELYFYIQARDSRLQDSRSDIYIVTIQDTAQLMSMDGMLGGVNLVPEYFRSQRQIIIDSERLLKERAAAGAQEFNSRSNNIGMDQKLLRLRYGKFLGEEDETEIGGHQEDVNDPAEFGDASAMLDAVSHKHDVAEDATFFEPELKAQLKATLTEMWKSELQLRLHKPAEALPFAYKALRLLKDLQQKSRVYVAKTSFKPPVIKADKRLSGELDKIVQPQNIRTTRPKLTTQNSLRLAAGILAAGNKDKKLSPAEILTLNDASRILASEAASKPNAFLEPLGILRGIIRSANHNLSSANLKQLEAALQRIIIQEGRSPQQKTSAPANDLSTDYFNNLKNNR